MHQGKYSKNLGGCFGVRKVGERFNNEGSRSYGIDSLSSSWFPLSFELVDMDSAFCGSIRPYIDFYTFAIVAILAVLICPSNIVVYF